MQKILLLHTNTEYAITLAKTIESLDLDYEIDVVSRDAIRSRLSHLLSGEYDLVQTDELLVNGVLSLGASFVLGTPFVVSIRGWADYTNAHGQYGKIRDASIRLRSKGVFGRASRIIYLSNRTQREIEQNYRVDDGIVIGRPIDIAYYRNGTIIDEDPFSGPDTFNLLTVTNLRYEEKYKGVKNILKGLENQFERHEGLRYIVAGGGNYLDDLQEFLEKYPFSDRVDVLGFREDIPDLLASADGFVYVSYLDAYPTVVLEAQAAALPIIGGDAVGVPEVVGDAGLLCPPTPDGISSAVNRILEDDSFRTELAKKSEEKMATYNEECARQHVDVWNEVLGYS